MHLPCSTFFFMYQSIMEMWNQQRGREREREKEFIVAVSMDYRHVSKWRHVTQHNDTQNNGSTMMLSIPVKELALILSIQGAYSQHFIFFENYEWDQ